MAKKKKVAIRRTWKIRPTTRVEEPPTIYNRKKEKRKLKQLLQDPLN